MSKWSPIGWPLKSGIAVCSANAPRQLPTAHAVEAGEAGPTGFSQIPRWESSPTLTMNATSHSTIVNPVTVSHDRTRPLSNNSGHCLESHTGSHLEFDETDSPDNTTVISHLITANSSTVFHDSTRPPSKNSGHCLENDAGSQLEDADTATSSTMVDMISPYSNVDPFTTHKTRTRRTSKNSGHCLECHNGSHSENRDKPTSSKPFRKSSRQTMVREFL